jgi:dCTP deaminase
MESREGEKGVESMSILAKDEMQRLYRDGSLVITPILDSAQIRDNSLDLRLGNEFIVTRRTTFPALDPSHGVTLRKEIQQYQERIRINRRKSFVLHSNQLVLGCTLEYVALPKEVAGYVVGRSSWGRLGLVIATATAVAPLFKGSITLELLNLGEVPLVLYPGVRIAQLVLHTVKGSSEYTGRYRYPTGPEFSRVYEDEDLEFWGDDKRIRHEVDLTHEE